MNVARLTAAQDLKGGDLVELGQLVNGTMDLVEVFDATPNGRRGTMLRFTRPTSARIHSLFVPDSQMLARRS